MDPLLLAKRRLGLLAAPVVIAALAATLSACGSPALTGSSDLAGSAALSGSPAPGSSSAPSTSSTPSDTSPASNSSASANDSASSGASVTDFCETWRLTAPYFNQDFAVLGTDPSYDYSTEAVFLEPTVNGIQSDLSTAAQHVPSAVDADMATLSSYWIQVEADFQAQTDANNQVTVGQVKAYILANPPAQSDNVAAAVQNLSEYLAATCDVSLAS